MEEFKTIYKNRQPKASTSNKHFWWSMAKSGLRLFGCGYLLFGDIVATAVVFAAAEVLGVIEEF